jgi:hypothetical protein
VEIFAAKLRLSHDILLILFADLLTFFEVFAISARLTEKNRITLLYERNDKLSSIDDYNKLH